MVLLALIILLLLSAFPVWLAVKRLAGARQGEGMSAGLVLVIPSFGQPAC